MITTASDHSPMASAERITFLVSADEKRRLAREAKKAQVTVSDLIRGRLFTGPNDDEAQVRALLAEVLASTQRAHAAADRMLERAGTFEARAREREQAARRAAERELSGLDTAALAAGLGLMPATLRRRKGAR